MKRIAKPATAGCSDCNTFLGEPAMCLGCGLQFRPCRYHWPLFTYCSKKCATPHRRKLNQILFKPLTRNRALSGDA